jgi:hypothetical protein
MSHPAVKDRADAPDVERLIEDSGCAGPYFALEECMGAADRVWSKCQAEVRALKACNQQRAAGSLSQPSAAPPAQPAPRQ